MKKLLFLVAALAFVGTASAQKGDVREQKLTFGPKVGFNSSDLFVKTEDDKTTNAGARPDFMVGGFVEYRVAKWFAVSTDILYSRQGGASEVTISSTEASTTMKEEAKLQYLNVPILANFYVTKGLALKTGIQPGFLLGAKNDITTDGERASDDVKALFSTVDFSIPVGISYTFKFGLVLDVRYSIGVSNIVNKKFRNDDFGGERMRNNVLAISAGWKF